MKVRAIIILFVMSLPCLVFAQPPDFTGESPYGVTDVPFDDGVNLLVIAAIVYGLFKVWAYRKNEKMKKKLLKD